LQPEIPGCQQTHTVVSLIKQGIHTILPQVQLLLSTDTHTHTHTHTHHTCEVQGSSVVLSIAEDVFESIRQHRVVHCRGRSDRLLVYKVRTHMQTQTQTQTQNTQHSPPPQRHLGTRAHSRWRVALTASDFICKRCVRHNLFEEIQDGLYQSRSLRDALQCNCTDRQTDKHTAL